MQDNRDHQTRDKSKCRLKIHKGVFHRIDTTDTNEVKQVIVPTKYREAIMKLANTSIVGGHLGAKKTTDRITSNFHWSGITRDISRFCKSCDICQRTIPKGRVSRIPLGTMPLMEKPFCRVVMELIRSLSPVSKGNRYILTVVD